MPAGVGGDCDTPSTDTVLPCPAKKEPSILEKITRPAKGFISRILRLNSALIPFGTVVSQSESWRLSIVHEITDTKFGEASVEGHIGLKRRILLHSGD